MTTPYAIVGPRDARQYLRRLTQHIVFDLPDDAQVVSGGARGIDTYAEEFARQRRSNEFWRHADIHADITLEEPPLPPGVTIFPEPLVFAVTAEDWHNNPQTAGFIRNGMIVSTAHHVIALWDGCSNGTSDTIRKAQAERKLRHVYFDTGVVWSEGDDWSLWDYARYRKTEMYANTRIAQAYLRVGKRFDSLLQRRSMTFDVYRKASIQLSLGQAAIMSGERPTWRDETHFFWEPNAWTVWDKYTKKNTHYCRADWTLDDQEHDVSFVDGKAVCTCDLGFQCWAKPASILLRDIEQVPALVARMEIDEIFT